MTRTTALLTEIARPGSTRKSIATIYARGIAGHQHWSPPTPPDAVDWPTVNRALLKRYQPSGLDYIKRVAWVLWTDGRRRATR